MHTQYNLLQITCSSTLQIEKQSQVRTLDNNAHQKIGMVLYIL